MGFRLNRLDEPVFMVGSKPMLTELAFIIDWRVVMHILSVTPLTFVFILLLPQPSGMEFCLVFSSLC